MSNELNPFQEVNTEVSDGLEPSDTLTEKPSPKKPSLEKKSPPKPSLTKATDKQEPSDAEEIARTVVNIGSKVTNKTFDYLHPGTFIQIVLILIFTCLISIPTAGFFNLFSEATGYYFPPITWSIVILIYSILASLIPMADRKLGEKQFSLTESNELKEKLKSMWDDKDYHNTIDSVVFFRQSENKGRGSYAIGMRKISILESQCANARLGIITHELAHLRYKDSILGGMVYRLAGAFEFLMMIPVRIILFPLWIISFFSKTVGWLRNIIIMAINVVLSLFRFTLTYFMFLASKSSEYRADAYTVNNGTAEELLADFERWGDDNLGILEMIQQTFYSTHPSTKSRINSLSKKLESKQRETERAKAREVKPPSLIQGEGTLVDIDNKEFY